MGAMIDSITAFKDAITGSAFEALAAADGDSLAVRWFGEGTQVELLEAWGANNVTKCDFSIRSPLLHDNTRGIRFAHMFNPTQSGADGNPNLYLAPYQKQKYYPTDTLTVETLGAASDDVTFSQLLSYTGPGVPSARLLTQEEVEARTKNLIGIRVSPAAATSTSTYGTAEAINADDDRLKANTDYAWLGLTSDLPFTSLAMNGPDSANFRAACPGYRDEAITSGWFMDISRRFRIPFVPIISSNNKGNTLVRLADVGGGTAPLICLLLAELS